MRPQAALVAVIAFSSLMAASSVARGQDDSSPNQVATSVEDRATGGFHADGEIDPMAYILKGFSIHVGLGWKRWRLDLGNFAMAVPKFAHGNSDYDVSFDGFGAKLQYFLFAEQVGGFVGFDGGANKIYLERKGTDLAARNTQYGVGANAGWRSCG